MAGWMQAGVDADERLDLAQTGQVLRRSARMLRPYRRRAMLAVGLLVIWTASILAGPVLVRVAIDHGIRAGEPTVLNRAVIGYLFAAISAYLSYRVGIRSLAWVGEEFLRDLRNRVFRAMLDQSPSYYDRTKAGVLVSRMTADIDSLGELMQYGLLMFISALLILTGSLITLALLNWQLLLVCLLVIPILVPASVAFKREANNAYLQVRDGIAGTLSSLQEGISGVRVIQSFAREPIEGERFGEVNGQLYRAHMRSVRAASWYLPVVDFSGVLTTGLAIGVGGVMVRSGRMSLGTVAAFVLLLANMFDPVQQLSQLFNMIQSATASLAKLFEVIDSEIEVVERVGAVELPEHGDLVIEDLAFRYGSGPPVLSGIDLTIRAGERLALVGPTGAGKSSLAKVLARLYDPESGSVRFGGVDLRQASLASLRQRIVVVPQEGFLFNGTIADNIRVANSDASDTEVELALERIGALERVLALPDGLSTEVRERGGRLSAGERQLVSLARAAIVNPAVLVLDEATSSLDPGTESIVEHAMEVLMAGRTVIVIAHRLSTAQRCDRIGVVDHGRIVEIGPHDELVSARGAYAELFAAWERGLVSP